MCINTKILFEQFPNISDKQRADLLSVVSTRGKYKGYILSSPPKEKWRNMVWNAVISWIAPVRVQTFNLICAKDNEKEIYNTYDKLLETTGIKTAINATEPDFRWNMYASRRDTIAERKALSIWLEKQTNV